MSASAMSTCRRPRTELHTEIASAEFKSFGVRALPEARGSLSRTCAGKRWQAVRIPQVACKAFPRSRQRDSSLRPRSTRRVHSGRVRPRALAVRRRHEVVREVHSESSPDTETCSARMSELETASPSRSHAARPVVHSRQKLRPQHPAAIRLCTCSRRADGFRFAPGPIPPAARQRGCRTTRPRISAVPDAHAENDVGHPTADFPATANQVGSGSRTRS